MKKTNVQKLMDWANEDIEKTLRDHDEQATNGTLPTPVASYDKDLNKISEEYNED